MSKTQVHHMVSVAIFWDQSYQDGIKLWMQVRDDDGRFQGLWEFPGGGIEDPETPKQAVVREVNEEVGIKLDNNDKLKLFRVYHHELDEYHLHLHTFLCLTDKIPQDQGRWFTFKTDEDVKDFIGKTPDANPEIISEVMNYINGLRSKNVEGLIWN